VAVLKKIYQRQSGGFIAFVARVFCFDQSGMLIEVAYLMMMF